MFGKYEYTIYIYRHEDSEYVLSFEIGRREGGFYSARIDRQTEPPSSTLVYMIGTQHVPMTCSPIDPSIIYSLTYPPKPIPRHIPAAATNASDSSFGPASVEQFMQGLIVRSEGNENTSSRNRAVCILDTLCFVINVSFLYGDYLENDLHIVIIKLGLN